MKIIKNTTLFTITLLLANSQLISSQSTLPTEAPQCDYKKAFVKAMVITVQTNPYIIVNEIIKKTKPYDDRSIEDYKGFLPKTGFYLLQIKKQTTENPVANSYHLLTSSLANQINAQRIGISNGKANKVGTLAQEYLLCENIYSMYTTGHGYKLDEEGRQTMLLLGLCAFIGALDDTLKEQNHPGIIPTWICNSSLFNNWLVDGIFKIISLGFIDNKPINATLFEDNE